MTIQLVTVSNLMLCGLILSSEGKTDEIFPTGVVLLSNLKLKSFFFFHFRCFECEHIKIRNIPRTVVSVYEEGLRALV